MEDDLQTDGSTLLAFLGETRHLWPLLLAVAGLMLANLRADLRRAFCLPPSLALWLVWLAVALCAAFAVQTKLTWYVLPALIPVAMLGGVTLASALEYRGARVRTCRVLAIAALALLILIAPSRWAAIRQAGDGERTRSAPSWAMGLKARALSAGAGAGELFFAGTPLPTLVWYSAMRCHFVETSELNRIELAGAPSRFRARYHDLIMFDADGGAWTVANLDDEWRAAFDADHIEPPAEPLTADSAGPSD